MGQTADEYRKKHQTWNNQRRDRHRRLVAEYKASEGCKYCPESAPEVLVFHHRDPSTKVYNISTIYRRSEKVIWKEIAKCDVLCQNCHQIVEYAGYDPTKVPYHKRVKRGMVHQHQAEEGCIDCRTSDPLVLMSVYVDESEKSREAITKMVLKGRPIDSIKDALKLTYTICRNCYSKRENILPEV